jgi:ribosomal protein S18 acetylase RimI-like enzyme
MNIEVLVSPSKAEHEAVLNPLLAHNLKSVGPSGKTDITFQLKDEHGQLLAGANGYTHWNYFYLAHLWVDEQQRGLGLGEQLMRKVEAQATARKCTHLWLDTFSFQAAGFYEKLGYARFGQLEDFPIGHTRVFFCKKLG